MPDASEEAGRFFCRVFSIAGKTADMEHQKYQEENANKAFAHGFFFPIIAATVLFFKKKTGFL